MAYVLGSRWVSLLVGCVMCAACTAPGMKLDLAAGDRASTVRGPGVSVILKPINAEIIRAQGPRQQNLPGLAPLLDERSAPYRVGAQDILLVTVWEHPEITLPLGEYRQDNAAGLVVDDEGYFYFPFVGRMLARGLTVAQLREALTSKLSRVLQNPQVDVKVIAYRSQKVYVGGEVRTPGVYNITDVPFTLAEAIHRSGGFLPSADDSRILLTRGDRVWQLDFQELMAAGNRIGQILLRDGDSLQVPNVQDAPVYMMGELARPGTMPLIHGNLSLTQALASAGGILGTTANARSIYVIRQARAANTVDVFHIDARNPASMVMADQFRLNPRDIVFVDAGTLVRFYRVMSLILPTVSAVTSISLTAAEIKYYLPRNNR